MLTFIVSDTHKWIMLQYWWYNQHDETLILDPCCHQQVATSTAITLNHFLKKAVFTVSCKKRISSKASLQRILSLNVPQHCNDCTTSQLLFEVWRARQNRSANVHVSAKSFLNILIVSWDVTKFRRPFFQPKAYVKTENTVFQSIRCGA